MDSPERERRGTGAGRPALNIERIYSTTVSAEELARALADHFRGQEFEAQVYRTSENRTVMQARKESLWRQLLGVTRADRGLHHRRGSAEHRPGGSRVGRCGGERSDRAGGGPTGAAGTAYGIWRRTSWTRRSGV